MNSTMKNVFAFIFGGVIGAGAAWYVTKTYYDNHMQEEINSVKEAYGRKKCACAEKSCDEQNETASPVTNKDADDPIRREVDTHKTNYVAYQRLTDNLEYGRELNFDPDSSVVAYVISDTEFGEMENEGYHEMSLVYYIDDILADYQDDEIIENVEGCIGTDWKKAFDKGEDIVYVRNDRRMCDYEILRSEKSYHDDILPTKPPTLEERHDL